MNPEKARSCRLRLTFRNLQVKPSSDKFSVSWHDFLLLVVSWACLCFSSCSRWAWYTTAGRWFLRLLETRTWHAKPPATEFWSRWRRETGPTSNWKEGTWWEDGSSPPSPASWCSHCRAQEECVAPEEADAAGRWKVWWRFWTETDTNEMKEKVDGTPDFCLTKEGNEETQVKSEQESPLERTDAFFTSLHPSAHPSFFPPLYWSFLWFSCCFDAPEAFYSLLKNWSGIYSAELPPHSFIPQFIHSCIPSPSTLQNVSLSPHFPFLLAMFVVFTC